jgi:tetratricopeptide (TPR) repeat protein
MLEVIREYALERLHASGEGETIRGQHAQYYLAVVEQAESELHGPQETEWLLRLDEETDNIRAALQWALDSSCADLGFRMAGALRWYWQLRGRLSEGRTWLEALMSAERKAGSLVLESVRAKALTTEGILTLAQGDLRTAETLVEASLVLARGQADRGNVADALHALGNATHARGDYQRAGGLYEEALDLYRDLGDQRAVATVLNDLGMLARDLGEWARARTRHEESLILRQALGGKSAIAHSFRNLGLVAHLAGDYEHAETRLEESLTLFQELGDVLGVADTLNHLGRLPQVRRDWRRASALFEGALVVYRELGDKRGVAWTLNNLGLIAYDQGEYARAVALHEESLAIHQALGSEDRAGISLYDLGNALHAVGDTRRAREAYAAAVSLLWTAGDKALLAFGIEGLARVALSEGQPKHMVRLCGAADALRVAIEAPLPPPDRPLYERTLAEAHRLLGEEEFAQAWSEGRTMTLEQAIAYALEGLGNVSEGGKP